MARPVLKCQHLGIQFGGLKAVDDFNMEIGESELMGLIGPNGAGKTTVFNLITGVYKPTEGSLYLNGERMNGKKTHQCNLVRRTEKGRLRRRGWGLRWEKAQKGGKGTNLRGFFED